MNEYRITKYDPAKRVNGIYTADDWTSISDIGQIFSGVILTHEEYQAVEDAHVRCVIEIYKRSNMPQLAVRNPEYHGSGIRLPKKVVDTQVLQKIVVDCLREKYWAKLEGDNFYIHFGYDYYLYVGTTLDWPDVNEICKKNHLFCEIFHSPYSDQEN